MGNVRDILEAEKSKHRSTEKIQQLDEITTLLNTVFENIDNQKDDTTSENAIIDKIYRLTFLSPETRRDLIDQYREEKELRKKNIDDLIFLVQPYLGDPENSLVKEIIRRFFSENAQIRMAIEERLKNTDEKDEQTLHVNEAIAAISQQYRQNLYDKASAYLIQVRHNEDAPLKETIVTLSLPLAIKQDYQTLSPIEQSQQNRQEILNAYPKLTKKDSQGKSIIDKLEHDHRTVARDFLKAINKIKTATGQGISVIKAKMSAAKFWKPSAEKSTHKPANQHKPKKSPKI